MALSKKTQDHAEIQQWAVARGAVPAEVASTEIKGQTGILRLEFPQARNANDSALKEISWDDFFEKFDLSGLALVYQEQTAEGEQSNFNKLIHPEAPEDFEARPAKKAPAKKTAGTKATREAKRTPARKSPAAKSSKKAAPTRKAASKKTASKKTATKKTASKKTASKKTAPARAAKSPASKAAKTSQRAVKKAPARKSASKKASGARSKDR